MDLAESVDDLICTFDGPGADTTMDTLAMFVFGWILAALFVLWLGKLVYGRIVLGQQASSSSTSATQVSADATASTASKTSLDRSASDKGPRPTLKSSDDLTKKTGIAAGARSSGGGGGGGGYVPPTPPVRKRLTRQSPGPDLRRTKYFPAPQCTGPDNVSVLWVNDVFQWLYSDLVIVNELLGAWLNFLNEYSAKSVTEQGVGVEFIRILPETNPPVLSNLFCECDTRDDVTITCDCEATPAFQLKCFRQKGEKVETSHYRVNVNRFRARLNIFCVSDKLKADVKCDGWPEIKVSLAPVGNIKSNLDETHLQEVLTEIVVNALRNTEVHLNLAVYPTCPRLIRYLASPGNSLPVHYDSMIDAFTSTPNHRDGAGDFGRIRSDKRLLVKIIRAAQLGSEQGCNEPYCVVEMDEPPQKNQTSVQKNTDSPFWDEHFLFNLSPSTAELLFEIYDRITKRFLGLGIVGIEELLINPSQRQTISLQSRPYESDPVSGTLTVEFLFIEGADIPTAAVTGSHPYKIKENLQTSSAQNALSDSFQRNDLALPLNDISNHHNGRYDPNSTAPHMSPLRSPLVIQSIQRNPSQRLVKVELSSEGNWKEVERIERQPFDSDTTNVVEDASDGSIAQQIEKGLQEANQTSTQTGAGGTNNYSITPSGTLNHHASNYPVESNGQDPNLRGRSRKRRDFFGTIKRRLNKSKTRSKSAGPPGEEDGREDSLNRSISADRNRPDDSLRLPIPGREETSRRSSLSEASGLSSASTRTYINEASTLVLETVENGIKRHYLVPLSLAQKTKWRKKGTKLHIYNEHTFIAKHLSGGIICQVCSKSIARRIGKQGYECRDCQLRCHKHCHVKANDTCPSSTIHNIELSYIANPYTDKNIRML